MAKETVRTRVSVPGDTALPDDFYAERHGPEARTPLNQTAFRVAERKYRTDSNHPDILDFSREHTNPLVYVVEGREWLRADGVVLPVYGIRGVDGFYYVSGAMTNAEQLHFAKQSFMAYPKHPNTTNLHAHYILPTEGLFPSYRDNTPVLIPRTNASAPVSASGSADLESKFIRKLRWITLGYQYNWTTKEYNFDKVDAASIFPLDLSLWSRRAVELLGFGADYRPEAGIVNFYQLDDTLTGHVDRSERNMHAPLLSMSIGLSAIFLLGGLNRDHTPVHAIKVRSGDVSVLSGPSRLSFHGVPKVLPECTANLDCLDHVTDDDTAACLKLLESCRININIRQVL